MFADFQKSLLNLVDSLKDISTNLSNYNMAKENQNLSNITNITNKVEIQWTGNSANVSSNVISGGNFIGKRQLKGNIANIFADAVNGGSFMDKRSPGIQKRQFNGNRVTVVEQVISGGTFIGKRQLKGNIGKRNAPRKKRNLVNLMANRIQNAKFSEQVNAIDASFDGIFSKCDSTGCVNIMG